MLKLQAVYSKLLPTGVYFLYIKYSILVFKKTEMSNISILLLVETKGKSKQQDKKNKNHQNQKEFDMLDNNLLKLLIWGI